MLVGVIIVLILCGMLMVLVFRRLRKRDENSTMVVNAGHLERGGGNYEFNPDDDKKSRSSIGRYDTISSDTSWHSRTSFVEIIPVQPKNKDSGTGTFLVLDNNNSTSSSNNKQTEYDDAIRVRRASIVTKREHDSDDEEDGLSKASSVVAAGSVQEETSEVGEPNHTTEEKISANFEYTDIQDILRRPSQYSSPSSKSSLGDWIAKEEQKLGDSNEDLRLQVTEHLVEQQLLSFERISDIPVTIEHKGRHVAMTVADNFQTWNIFAEQVRLAIGFTPETPILLHYEDEAGDLAEIPQDQPSVLQEVLELGGRRGYVLVSVVQARQHVYDATLRARDRHARSERLLHAKKQIPLVASDDDRKTPDSSNNTPSSDGRRDSPQPGDKTNSTSGPEALLRQDSINETRTVLQQIREHLGLEYYDGKRPVNITKPFLDCIVAHTQSSSSSRSDFRRHGHDEHFGDDDEDTRSLRPYFEEDDLQIGNDESLAYQYSRDKVKGVCHSCETRFNFAKLSCNGEAIPVDCPRCDCTNIFVLV